MIRNATNYVYFCVGLFFCFFKGVIFLNYVNVLVLLFLRLHGKSKYVFINRVKLISDFSKHVPVVYHSKIDLKSNL